MRPRNLAAREALWFELRRQPPRAATDLATALGVSVPTLHRMLHELEPGVLTRGQARRTRHALRRSVRGHNADWPLYAVDEQGRGSLLGRLELVQPAGAWLDLAGTVWPMPAEMQGGWWPGLPYPLYDMRPQGYLGRQLARAEAARLAVAPDPQAWNDDEIVHVLAHAGSDTSGNLILGDPAYQRWLDHKLAPPEPIRPQHLTRAYARLAEEAVARGVPGSSAAGEFPKFPALRELKGSATPHVLVKFSGAGRGAAVQRWSDLLVCEHLALEHAATMPGVQAAKSRIVQDEARTFLEVERFDRHGDFGRSPLVCLATLDATFVGSTASDWPARAAALAAPGLALLDADALHRVECLWWFGQLIANTDMHAGNLSFTSGGSAGRLQVAPAYDMLPMLHAPLAGGEVPVREFQPALPLPTQQRAWLSGCSAALAFWRSAAADGRVSRAFRSICAASAQRVEAVAARL